MTRRPGLIAVDDDPEVLGAVERDLRSRYASRYRVIAAPSGAEALEVVDRLVLRGEEVALVVADQRMPHMAGTELLAAVGERLDGTRRVLLTAYADTDAAIDAINQAGVDYYILKPWDPPEERLYPVIDDLLDDWQASRRRPPEIGLRVVGDRWSQTSHRLRDFLTRNQVPFRWLEAGRSPEAATLMDATPQARLPMVVTSDGEVLADPTPAEVAAVLGMQQEPDSEFYDVVVVGAGPAGLAAAVYGASEGLTTAVVEAEAPGGQAGTSSLIENYLGFPGGVSGSDLARRAHTQARKFGAMFLTPKQVTSLERDDPYRVLTLDDGNELRCSAVIVATGVQYRELAVPGVAELVGRGVFYGATVAASDIAGAERVVVVGGANSAGQAAAFLSGHAERVSLIIRSSSIRDRMSTYLAAQIEAMQNVDILAESEVSGVTGDGQLESVTVTTPTGQEVLDTQAMFVFIGARPRTEWLEGVIARDQRGFLVTGSDLAAAGRWALDRDPMLLETSVPGAFAVGDVRSESVKRVASAVGEGSVAVHLVHAYLAR